MKLAVTYDNGDVFPHFGRTEAFKVYEIRAGKILSSEVVSAGGVGHEALAGLLAQHRIDLLICGGMGQGAQKALADAGIVVISGASGDADEAVRSFLRGELTSAGVNCDHHGHHEHAEDGGEEPACGQGCGQEGGCGSAGGCAGCSGCGPQIVITGKNAGKICVVHYRGTFNDGTQFDSSYDRGKPLEFICGAGMMIPGFDKAVVDMEPGEIRDVHLMPEDAYGEADPEVIFTVPIREIPGAEGLSVGERVYLTSSRGQPLPVLVAAKDDENITFDANHEMAGKELNFRIELVEIR